MYADDAGFTASDGTYTSKVLITSDSTPPAGWKAEVYRANTETGTKDYLGYTTTNSYNDTTASAGIIYYYFLRACNGDTCFAYSSYDTGYKKLETPTIDASDSLYTDRIRISFHSINATNYEIQRSTSADSGYSTIIITSNNSTIYDDLTALPGTTYYYKVIAICTHEGATTYSDLSTSDTGFRKLLRPTSIEATDGKYSDKVEIYNYEVQGALTYIIARADTNSGEKTEFLPTANTLYTYYGSPQGLGYYYFVKACGDNGVCTEYSTPDTGYEKLDAPTNINATDGNYTNSVVISCDEVIGANNYIYYRATTPDGTGGVIQTEPTNSYIDMNIVPGIDFYYYIRAANTTNVSNQSDESSRDSGYRSIIIDTNVQATYGTYTDKVVISLYETAGGENYQIYRDINSSGDNKEFVAQTQESSYNDISGIQGNKYYYFVRASGINGIWSDFSTSVSSGYRSLEAPTGVIATDGEYTDSVIISFNEVIGATSYNIYRSEVPTAQPSYLHKHADLEDLTYEDTSAIAGIKYYYYVKAQRRANGYTTSGELSDFDTGYAGELDIDVNPAIIMYLLN